MKVSQLHSPLHVNSYYRGISLFICHLRVLKGTKIISHEQVHPSILTQSYQNTWSMISFNLPYSKVSNQIWHMAVDYVYAPHLTVELQYVQVWFKLHLIQVLQCTQHPVLHQSIYSVYATKQHALYLQILYNTPVHECRLWLLKLKLKKNHSKVTNLF